MKFFFLLILITTSTCFCTQRGEQALNSIAEIIEKYKSPSNTQWTETYHRQLLDEVHTKCTDMPGVCTADRVSVKEVTEFSIFNIVLGAFLMHTVMHHLRK